MKSFLNKFDFILIKLQTETIHQSKSIPYLDVSRNALFMQLFVVSVSLPTDPRIVFCTRELNDLTIY